jgi:hypothetical protein
MRSTTMAVLTYPTCPDGLTSAMTSTHDCRRANQR